LPLTEQPGGADCPAAAGQTGRSLAAVAHDLNNSLTVILGAITLTARHAAGDPAMTRLLENMRQAAEHGSGLVRELMAADAPPPAPEPLPTLEPPLAAAAQHRILVVEDDADVAEVAVAVLEQLGHAVEHAASGPAAVTCLAARPYDLVFSDIVMPGGMTGVDLAEMMRQTYPAIPVLLATGYSAAALGPGALRFPVLRKPYSVRELSARVTQLLTLGEIG